MIRADEREVRLQLQAFRGPAGPRGEKGDPGDEGRAGVSPVVTVTGIDGGHRVSISDAGGVKAFDVMDGQDGTDGDNGVSPTVTVTTITGGHRVTITDVHGTQSFDVADGKDGTGGTGGTGTGGEDGGYYTPAVDASGNLTWTASKAGMTAVASTNIKGPKGDTGAAGPAGTNGSDGADGYTPVRGTDYWTPADKQQIVADVLAALPNASGVSF